MPKRLDLIHSSATGVRIPFQSSVATPAVNVFGLSVTPWQVGAAQSTSISLTYAAWTGFQTQPFTVALTSFPAAVNLSVGTQAVIVPTVTVTANPATASVLLGSPTLQIYYGNGGTLLRGLSGTPAFSLQVGGKYTNLSLAGSLTAYAPSAQGTTVVTINVSVVLLGLTV